ncbi:hypothetical protein D3C87_733040 [compost metagenome]
MKWFQQIAQRMIWAHRALVADPVHPVIKLENGVTLDLARNKVILEGDFALHVTGNLTFTADGDLELKSGVGLGHKTGTLGLNATE